MESRNKKLFTKKKYGIFYYILTLEDNKKNIFFLEIK